NTDLFSVALHELGHALGLGHADSPTAVMYPYYKMVTGLSSLDISTAQTLYAAQTGTPSVPVTPPASAPLTMMVNTPAAATSGASIAITGTTSGGKGSVVVAWSTEHRQSGTAVGSASWTISSIGLASGANPITITAADSLTHISQSYVVTRQATSTPAPPVTPSGPKGSDTTPPTLTINSPSATAISTSATYFVFSGTASDNVAVASVTWSTNTGSAGTASGTTQWNASVPLLVGTNTVTIRAADA